MLFLLRCVFWLGLVFAHINWAKTGADMPTTASLLADVSASFAAPAAPSPTSSVVASLAAIPVKPLAAKAPPRTGMPDKASPDKASSAKPGASKATTINDLMAQAGTAVVQQTKDYCQSHAQDCLGALIAASDVMGKVSAPAAASAVPAGVPKSTPKSPSNAKGAPTPRDQATDWRG